jgi:hypothetical protein
LKGKIIGIKPLGTHALCFKCGKKASHIAYYGNGDPLLHAENFCNSCIEAAVDLYVLDMAHKFKEEIKRKQEELIATNNQV